MSNDTYQAWFAKQESELAREILRLEKTITIIEAEGIDAIAVDWEPHLDWRLPKSQYVRDILAKTPFKKRRKLDYLLEIEDIICRQAQPTSGYAHAMGKQAHRATFDACRR